MKRLYILILLVLISCIKETEEQKDITVSVSGVPVKTGDKIGLYHDSYGLQNVSVEYTESDTMNVRISAGATHLHGLFPYSSSAGQSPTEVNVDIPNAQAQDIPGELTGSRWPMAATAAILDDHASLVFKPFASLLALNIYSSEPEEGEAVTYVRITPTVNSNFCGNAAVDITSSSPTFTSGNSSRPVSLTVNRPKALPGKRPADPRTFEDRLYICLARQSYTYVRFEIQTSTGRLYTITSDSNVIDCAEHDVAILNINLSEGKIYIIKQSEEQTEVDCTHASLSEVIQDPVADDISEDIIPDFSRVGYHYGDDEIPHYDNIIATLYPTGDDNDRADDIQAALDLADGSTNSVVLLKAGDYYVSRQIDVNRSHLVLRGEGGARDSDSRTRLIATGDGTMNTCIRLGGANRNQVVDAGSTTEIIESYIPVGRMSLRIHDASRFNVGDRIMIYRPGTQQWLHDIRMDSISDGENWLPETFHISQERIITGIVGNKIMLDAPVVMAIDSYYGGGYVVRIHNERITESGVEDLFIESAYDPTVTAKYTSAAVRNCYPDGIVCVDEDHCNNGVKVVSCEHCWVRSVSGQHFIFSLVGLGTGSRNATIEDCHSYEPISLIQGSRRYAFNANGKSTMGLVKGCTAEYDRHQFVTTSLATGPLVFTGCSATKCLSETGPHCFWATGVLYDCIKMDSAQISVQDSDYVGTGASHGWQGANHVLWNCEAPTIVCQSPWTAEGCNPTGRNYCIGCIGRKALTSTRHYITKEWLTDRPQGEWIPDPGEDSSNSSHVTSGTYYGAVADGLSLYEAQLTARKAAGIRAIPAEWYE